MSFHLVMALHGLHAMESSEGLGGQWSALQRPEILSCKIITTQETSAVLACSQGV
jgi:hypothetical protein